MTGKNKVEHDAATQRRIDAAPNEKVRAAMEVVNAVKRGNLLYELGYCTRSYGTCKEDNGKIAKLFVNERGQTLAECKNHAMQARKLNQKATGSTPRKVAKPKPVAKVKKPKAAKAKPAGPAEPKPKAAAPA